MQGLQHPNLNAGDTPLGWLGIAPAHVLVTHQSQSGASLHGLSHASNVYRKRFSTAEATVTFDVTNTGDRVAVAPSLLSNRAKSHNGQILL